MILKETKLYPMDNSGLKRALCISKLRPCARVTDIVLVSIKRCKSHKKIKQGEKWNALITQQSFPLKRKNDFSLKFRRNRILILKKGKDLLPLANRAYKKVAFELRYKKFIRSALISRGFL